MGVAKNPISRILKKVSFDLWAAENIDRTLTRYQNLTRSDDWRVYQNLIIAIGNGISQYMLSKDYSELDSLEKDVQQRVFYMTKELLEFMIDPAKNARSANKVMQYNRQQEATFQRGGKRPTMEKRNG